ncbi:hypothetical protein BKP45_12550 [Anaerobacillus alkalidiazotrophicus]|uniref:DNA-binding response regulator n=1 Tax=Anaerobacillus alkalidiazotrophicus TaxID=472963 RepID=A0A1S2M126_9BACI|nr:response regulator transcription factor [Anaerobacillus alkalidiazotrophicus]OIJ18398.1 hypothetical protein BKP45_18265 [Anaerobacillus alkalidiazotrophicus]OIJ19877.1 hypothetical protein BKP45_12550 [Anaerobacillus alkalidiazotrophicus]
MSQLILKINPDPIITTKIREDFNAAGFGLIHTNDIEEALEIVDRFEPTIILLDLDFIRFQAFDFCRTLRLQKDNWTPLILMSEKDEEFDLVLGLELGADDYIRKPVRSKELVARVKSILRRQSISWPKNKEKFSNGTNNHDIIIIGKLTICPSNYTIRINDKIIDFTRKEFEIILYLSQNKGTAISREQLLSVLNEEEFLADVRVIDVFISRIREKIEPCRSKPSYIKTVRGVGYMMLHQNLPYIKKSARSLNHPCTYHDNEYPLKSF